MSRRLIRVAAGSALLLAMAVTTSQASNPPGLLPVPAASQHVQPVQYQYHPHAQPTIPTPDTQPGYPYLNAPLYPVPRPDIPIQMGSTLITNQAFHPQEMLYPHDYTAMYPPFYYRSKGNWILTPWGVRTDERWELQGTKVKVKYRSHAPIWSGVVNGDRDYFLYDQNWSNNPPMPRRDR